MTGWLAVEVHWLVSPGATGRNRNAGLRWQEVARVGPVAGSHYRSGAEAQSLTPTQPFPALKKKKSVSLFANQQLLPRNSSAVSSD